MGSICSVFLKRKAENAEDHLKKISKYQIREQNLHFIHLLYKQANDEI